MKENRKARKAICAVGTLALVLSIGIINVDARSLHEKRKSHNVGHDSRHYDSNHGSSEHRNVQKHTFHPAPTHNISHVSKSTGTNNQRNLTQHGILANHTLATLSHNRSSTHTEKPSHPSYVRNSTQHQIYTNHSLPTPVHNTSFDPIPSRGKPQSLSPQPFKHTFNYNPTVPLGGTYHPPGAPLPQNVVYYSQPPVSSSGPSVDTSFTYDRTHHHRQSEDGGINIVIHNDSKNSKERRMHKEPQTNQPTQSISQSTTTTTEISAPYGVICVPTTTIIPNPNDNTKTIVTEGITCYPAPPPPVQTTTIKPYFEVPPYDAPLAPFTIV